MMHNSSTHAAQQQALRAETAPYEGKLAHFKVTELQNLLTHYKLQKLGKKNELYARCVELLRNPQLSRQVMEKIREIEARVNGRPTPYPLPTMNANSYHQQQQQQQMAYRPSGGMGGFSGYGGMPGLNTIGMSSMHSLAHAQNPANFNPRPARNLTPMALPFYDPIFTLLEPQELPCNPNGNKTSAQMTLNFIVPAEHQLRLQTRSDVFPRTEVQMRFFNATGDILNIEQPDDFPLNVNVKINESPVTLPNVIPTNKPNVEPKRPSRPVNLTQYVTGHAREKTHRVRIDWTADKRTWAMAIYLVSRVDATILRKRVESSPSFDLPYETTEATIRKRLGGGDDDDVAMDSLKISLLCPLGKTRMTVAARSRDCTHLQCFDLDLYLQMNEKRPTWKCCVCSSSAPYHKLIIDKYFMRMLKELDRKVTDVELLKDGSFRVIAEDDVCDLSDDDECAEVKPKAAAAAGSGAAGAASTKKEAAGGSDDIITLSDDEEVDDIALRTAIRASMPVTAAAAAEPPRTPVSKAPMASSSSSLENSIICLSDDDSPPRPAKNTTGAPCSSSSASSAASAARPSTSSPTVPCSASLAAAGYGRPAPSNLADALSQAGLRTNAPGSLHMGGVGPMSAAIAVSNAQQSIFNWAQAQAAQQPQSAPPMMNPQMNPQWGAFMQQPMAGYGQYYSNQMQQQQQPQQAAPQPQYGYPAAWGAQAQSGAYGAQPSNGVIRRPEDQQR
ncbi:hypothetical protein PFISCL1PPCAC_18081 [Pristionchus fissidentatus]|uniref:Gei-17 n=1 Tax=Pristionchus fissidentatus TaxID=1538716 RepID=A0AAV5WAC9_9BILA|nr:hypothetical protein PFISCL1PPCAC_18081 [Pristionchus fissidentatus]